MLPPIFDFLLILFLIALAIWLVGQGLSLLPR